MNNTDRICNIQDTLQYLTEKMDKDMRMVKNTLKSILTKKEKCNCKNQCSDCVCNHENLNPIFWKS